VKPLGPLDHCPFYIRVERTFAPDLPTMDHCMYEAGLRVRALRGAKPAAHVVTPYFNRTAEHFSSHFQTPPARLTFDPAIVRPAGPPPERTLFAATPATATSSTAGSSVAASTICCAAT
jgi:hypothetical protein